MSFAQTYRDILQENQLSEYAGAEYGERFEILFHRLVERNQQVNLTAITDEREVILRHFADCLKAAHRVKKGQKVLDVGCGGGFPVLPLAIVCPDCTFTALDSTAKKLVFVEDLAKQLQLKVRTVSARAEELALLPEWRESFDLVVSRAVARLNLLDELTLPFVKVGGHFLALKGSDGKKELAEAEKGILFLGGSVSDVESFELSDAGGRVLIELEKRAPTPPKYPRAFGKIKKNPL